MVSIERDDFLATYTYKETDFRHYIALCEPFGFWDVQSRVSNTWTLLFHGFDTSKHKDFVDYVRFRKDVLVEQLQSMMRYVRIEPSKRGEYIHEYFTQPEH